MNPTEANNHKSAHGSFASLLDRLTGVTPEPGAVNGNHKGSLNAADLLRAFDAGNPGSRASSRNGSANPTASSSQLPPRSSSASRDPRTSPQSEQDEGTQLSYERALRLHARHQSTWGRQPVPASNEIPKPRQILNQAAPPSRPVARATDTSLLNPPAQDLDDDVFARIASLASHSVHPAADRSTLPVSPQRSHQALNLRISNAAPTQSNFSRSAPAAKSSLPAKIALTPAPIPPRKQPSRRVLPSSPALSAKAQARANTNHRTTSKPVPELKLNGKIDSPSKPSLLAPVKVSSKSSAGKTPATSRGSRNSTIQTASSSMRRQTHATDSEAKLKATQRATAPSRAASRPSKPSLEAIAVRRDPVKTLAQSRNENARPTAASEALELQVKQLIERLDALERMPAFDSAQQMQFQTAEEPEQIHQFDDFEETGQFEQPGRLGQLDQLEEAEEFRLEHRTSTISVRLNEAEFSTLRLRATESGISVSAYMRSCVLEAEQLRAQVKQALSVMRAAAYAEPLAETPYAELSDPNEESGFWNRLQEYAGNLWRPQTITTLKA